MNQELVAVLSMIGTLLLIVLVFVGAYYFSRLVGQKYSPSGKSTFGAIEVLDSRAVGKEQSLMIVRAGGKTLLIGVTADNITRIDELDPERVSSVKSVASPSQSFANMFSDMMRKGKGGSCDDNNKE